MTNNSGKFNHHVSNKETETTAEELSSFIPAAPKVTLLQRAEEYFGKLWWAWLVLIVLIIKTR